MRILIACEFSGIVREAFNKQGHDAWSCDLLPTDIKGNHIQTDVLNILDDGWDMMIAHPPCTYLTVTGNKWFYDPQDKHLSTKERRPHPRFPDRKEKREHAVNFFMALSNTNIPKIAIENPVGIISTRWRKPDQIIQPYEFGDPHAKKTCLWLKNLPKLQPTKIVKPEYVQFKSGKRMAKWYVDAASYSKEKRTKLRNITFQGIAEAMSTQWNFD